MKFVRLMSRLFFGRWTRRIVWMPLGITAILFAGLYIEAKQHLISPYLEAKWRKPLNPVASQMHRSSSAVPSNVEQPIVRPSSYQNSLKTDNTAPHNLRMQKTVWSMPGSPQPGTEGIPPATAITQTAAMPNQIVRTGGFPTTNVTPYTATPYGATPNNAIGSPRNTNGFSVTPVKNQGQVQHAGAAGLPVSNLPQAASTPNAFANTVHLPPSIIYAPPMFPFQHPSNQLPSTASVDDSKLNDILSKIRGYQGNEESQLRTLVGQLLDVVTAQFDDHQDRERTRIDSARQALNSWEEAITERAEIKRSLVSSQVAQLLQAPDPMSWSFSGSSLISGPTSHRNFHAMLAEAWATKDEIKTPKTEEPQDEDSPEQKPSTPTPVLESDRR